MRSSAIFKSSNPHIFKSPNPHIFKSISRPSSPFVTFETILNSRPVFFVLHQRQNKNHYEEARKNFNVVPGAWHSYRCQERRPGGSYRRTFSRPCRRSKTGPAIPRPCLGWRRMGAIRRYLRVACRLLGITPTQGWRMEARSLGPSSPRLGMGTGPLGIIPYKVYKIAAATNCRYFFAASA